MSFSIPDQKEARLLAITREAVVIEKAGDLSGFVAGFVVGHFLLLRKPEDTKAEATSHV